MPKLRALVTGGCGFVGRHFVKRLLSIDYHVTVVDDLSTGLEPQQWPDHLKPNGQGSPPFVFHHKDFRDFAKTEPVDFDLILHLAAVVGGRVVIENDPLKVATDLSIDATFFNWVSKARPQAAKILYFSSSAVYPVSLQTKKHHELLSEEMISLDCDSIGMPDMTYGWSKLSGEYLARYAVQQYGLDVLIYRPFSGYGEDQDLTYPFPSIINRIVNQERPLVVWGSGNQLRDFIYIEDVVSAVMESLRHLKSGESLNLGSGEGISFKQFATTACKSLKHNSEVINDSEKPEGVFARVGNCNKMFEFYRPAVGLEEEINLVYTYLKNARPRK